MAKPTTPTPEQARGEPPAGGQQSQKGGFGGAKDQMHGGEPRAPKAGGASGGEGRADPSPHMDKLHERRAKAEPRVEKTPPKKD